jgi:hypothetical protein
VPKLTYDELVELVVSIVLPSLHHASDRLPLNTVGFSEALHACMRLRIPSAESWFETQLEEILYPKEGHENTWKDLESRKIVAAAVIQIPVKDGRYQNLWDKFLTLAKFSTYALYALESNPKDRLRFLGAWWKTDSADRNRTLELILTQTIEVCREDDEHEEFLSCLRRHGGEWPMELRMAINDELYAKHIQPAFRPQTVAASR